MKKITILFSALVLTAFWWQANAQYCAAGPSSTFDSNLDTLSLMGDAGSSLAFKACPGVIGVQDLTATQTVNVTAGTNYTANVLFGTCGGNYTGVGEAWIDWNQNSVFDAGESIGTWSGNPSTVVNTPMTFTVPAGAINGSTVLRVMQREGGSLPLNPCGTYSWGSVTDFTVVVSGGVILTCPDPNALTATNVTATAADLGWTENGTATTWDVEWGTAGFVQGAGTMVTGTTTNPHNLTGLTASTSYEFYVRADCGGANGTSTWAGPFAFTTACTVMTLPWSENFDAGTTIPNCWNQGASNSELWIFASSGGHVGNSGTIGGTTTSGSNFAYVDDSSPDNTGTTLESPFVDVSSLTSPMLSFYLISNNEGNSNVNFSVDVWDGAAWNTGVYTSSSNTFNGEWEQISVILSSLTITGPVQLRFIVDEPSTGDFYDDVAIDDVTIVEAPTCPAPNALTATNITTTAADLGWTENGTATTWDVEWGAAGFTQGAGTMVTGTTTNPHNLTGLTANTSYEFYVRADCGGGDLSTWAGPFAFNTPCVAMTLPYTETFDGVAPALPTCWVTNNATEVITTASCTGSINESLQLDGTAGNYAYSPVLDASGLDSLHVEYLYRAGDTDCGNAPEISDSVKVDYWDGSAWMNLAMYGGGANSPVVFTPELFNLTAGLTSGFYLRFEIISGTGTSFDNWNFDSLMVTGFATPVGINNIANNVTLNVYPNPTTGVFNLNVNTTDINELNIKVMNMQGQVVFAKNNFKNINNVNEQIDLSENANGIYFVTVTTDKGVITHKVVVQ